MTTRRSFIKTVAAVPPLLSFRALWAANPAPDSSRQALIIGNSSYRDAPLVNPTNDAKAIGALFTQAGFTVDSQLNTRRSDMVAAIERFGAAAKRPETKLVVFYYAGHGAQLDWRNYLLPVDAVVEKQEHMRQRCVDLGLLLGQLSAAKDKTFVIILDACRNNPFGSAYRPEQKGLSQFDAPVGSLLAYATAPGNVASDGEGQNGLYTENLVRELGKRGARIEDALKRVRLNVRLASHGEQIPWETTSLESDVFIFNEGRKKLSETELEQLVEADVTEWARIRSSNNVDDWVSYLRTFPNGRFAEIAQMRLTRLLAENEKVATEKRLREEQQLLEQQRIERERLRLAEEQRLAAERKQLEQQQLQETRRREEEQKLFNEQKRLDQERMERERARLAQSQHLAAERKRLEDEQLQQQKRREEELQQLEAKRRAEQERLDHERLRIVEAERLAAERKLQAEQRQAAKVQATAPATAASSAAESADLTEGQAFVPAETLAAVSHNPYSAGRFPLGRKFTVGDFYMLRNSDLLTGVVENTFQNRVTRVDEDNDRVVLNHGKLVFDLMGNTVENRDNTADVPQQLFPAELQVGKRWTSLNSVVAKNGRFAGQTKRVEMEVRIQAREKIRVPAGEFNAFRIEASGWSVGESNSTKIETNLWVVPGINMFIRRERIKRRGNRLIESRLTELVAIRQAASGLMD